MLERGKEIDWPSRCYLEIAMTEWADEIGLSNLAQPIAADLRRRGERLVVAESCTGGLAAAALASVPGISEYFCGSAVTYREQTKIDWLGVPSTTIAGAAAVSPETTREMAQGALLRTPEADWSAAITGHLGPNAPSELDGLVFVSIAKRDGGRVRLVDDIQGKLQNASRQARQVEAAGIILDALWRRLADESKP